ncbi:MAG: NAD(P)H-quinone oxidoreductase [Anaerolineae bacterium]|nr:NAD(P)H-quinone oxidoreductase [Anaerolineae bacterium]
MKAIVLYGRGAEEVPSLIWEDVPDVGYGSDEVLVDVRAAGVNRADLLQARGGYPPPSGASEILGLEIAGVIVETGAAVTGWQPGDRVCALLPGGGYASLAAVPAGMLLRLPDNWDYITAAAIPEAWYTAYINLFLEGMLQRGERTLIHAGGSGVGTAAIQLAHAAGSEVFITAGQEVKLDYGRKLGAQLAVNYKRADFAAAVRDTIGGRGVDLILDPVGADYFERNLGLLRSSGRLVQIGLLSGAEASINLGLVLGKSLRIIGSRLRPRPLAEKITITRRFEAEVWPRLVSGELEAVVDSVFAIEEAAAAHAYVRQNRNLGKVILRR